MSTRARPLGIAALGAFLALAPVAGAGGPPQEIVRSAPAVSTASAPAGIAAPDVEWVSVAAPDGGAMLAAIARPDGSGQFPAVLILHGTHGFAQQYVELAREFARRGLVAVAACWFTAGGGAGAAFITPIPCPAGPPLVEASSGAAQERIGELIAAIRGLSYVDPNRVALFGHSRGGGASLNYVLRATDVTAAVLDSAGYPDDILAQASRVTVPILILHGTRECTGDGGSEMTTVQRARAFEAALRSQTQRVEARYYDACHNGIFEDRSQLDDSVQAAAQFLLRAAEG